MKAFHGELKHNGGSMALEIVWRNPTPPPKNQRRVEPLAADEFGSVYAVRTADMTVAFEVILGGAAA